MDIDKLIIDFLKSNSGTAFTPESILNRIETKIQNPEELEYFKKYPQGVMNRLAFNLLVKTHEYEGKNYYFLD